MRVLVLSWEYPPRIVGGISRHVEELSHAMIRAGIDLDVITCEYEDSPAYEEVNGVRIHRVEVGPENGDFLDWIRRLNEAMIEKGSSIIEQSDEPILIHAHDWLVEQAGKKLKLRHKAPLVATVHATEHGRNYGIHTDEQRYISQLEWELTYEAWRVIVCSSFMKDDLNKMLSTPMDKMDIIPNAVVPEKFKVEFEKDSFRADYALPDEKIVFHVGRDVFEKGGDVLIDALTKVIPNYNDVKLVIAGGKSREWLKKIAVEKGVADKVHFTGYIDDDTLHKLYAVSDVAVVPSRYEPFGIVALEAMAAGVPIVTSDVGGLNEIVDHGITGIKTWAGDSESLAWGITQVLIDKTNSDRMAEAAYSKVLDVFSWDKVAEQTIEVYKRVLSEWNSQDWGNS